MIKNVHDLPDDWKDNILTCYRQGYSDTEVMAEMSMTYRLWRHLLDTDASFHDVIQYGRLLKKAWWLRKGRENIDNNKFNATLYKAMMSGHFQWDSGGDATAPEADDESDEEDLDRQINELIKQREDRPGESG